MSMSKQKQQEKTAPAAPAETGGELVPKAHPVAGHALTPLPMSDVAQAFVDNSKNAIDRPSKVSIVKIDHKNEGFVLPSGELTAVVEGYPVYYFQTRRWYAKPPSPGAHGSPPDCWSPDLLAPTSESLNRQSDLCSTCKWNEWKSGRDGKSKACGTYTWLFLVNPEQFDSPPIGVLVVPPSSIRPLLGSKFDAGYLQKATAKHRAYQIVWSRFSLQRAGDVHCVLLPEMGPPAPDVATAKQLAELRDRFMVTMDEMRGMTPVETREGDAAE